MFAVQSVTFIPDLPAIAAMAAPGGMVYQFLEGKANEVKGIAEFLAPKLTGALAGSLFVQPFSDGDGIGFEIGTPLDYGLYQELGTINHGPQPFLRPALSAVMGGVSG